jgi:hypothetical protein
MSDFLVSLRITGGNLSAQYWPVGPSNGEAKCLLCGRT